MEPVSTFQLIAYIIYVVLVAGTILIVISENRNPIRTLSWVVVLILLPVIGLILFSFFGQDTRKMKHISLKYYKRVKKKGFESLILDKNIRILPEYSTLISLLERSSDAFVLQGSKIEVITSGKRKFEALMEDLENAKHHIHIEYFIFNNDGTGKKIKEILMRKAVEGVEVRFLYDNVANWMVPTKFYNEMKQTGVQVSSFMKVSFRKFRSKINYRNHRKIVVIDGNIGYTGGMNIADDYAINPNWRDTHLRITGNGVHGLQSNFLIDWYSSGEQFIEDKQYFPHCQKYTSNLMQVATGSPVNPWRNLLQATSHIVMGAKKYLYIQTPYFLPTDSLFQALQTAALGGVDIRLMVSQKSDSAYVDPAAHSYYGDLLRSGMRIYEYQDKFIHSKTMVADNSISVIGSANMDFRSFESNFEINCYIYDPEIAVINKNIFLEDLKNCKEILLSEWLKRSKWKKFIESVMRLFSPLM